MADDPRRSTLVPLQLGLAPAALPQLGAEAAPQAAVRSLARLLLREQPLLWLHLSALQRSIVMADHAALPALVRPAEAPAALPPLHLACLLGDAVAAEMLLAHAEPAALRQTDALGNTPWHWAALAGDADVARALGHRGAEEAQLNALGGTPSDYRAAWAYGPEDAIEVPLQARDGRHDVVRDQAACARRLGFSFMARSRLQVDCVLQWVINLVDPARARELADLAPDLARRQLPAFVEPAMTLRDDGPPWNLGVCLRESVAEGQAVSHYGGDLVHTLEIAEARVAHGANAYACHFAPTPALGSWFACHIDALRRGNWGSRFNSAHTAQAANLAVVSGFAHGLPQVLLVARRALHPGEQVAWFYGDGYWRGLGITPTPLLP